MNNSEELNKKLQSFWNEMFTKKQNNTIKLNEIKERTILDSYLKRLGRDASQIIDFGTGSGYALFVAKALGKNMQYGLGIDTSPHAIQLAQQFCEDEKIDDLEFICHDHTYLKRIPSNSFDGAICSNVLDVLPPDTTAIIIQELNRILKHNGKLLIKLNFYLTNELIEKLKMDLLGKNMYAINGVLRGVNYTTETWLSMFPNYKLIALDEYERLKEGPKDRIIYLQKA